MNELSSDATRKANKSAEMNVIAAGWTLCQVSVGEFCVHDVLVELVDRN
jgi:hypothetical protein